MTVQEFSTQFDVLWNNVSSNQAPGLNEYEKSVFLTKGQSQLVEEHFNHRIDQVGGGFDGTQKRQYDFSSIIRVANLYNVNTYANRIVGVEKTDKRSLVFLLPYDYYLSVNEVIFDDKWQYAVQPIDYPEYQRLMMKPYAFPVKRAAWRLITDKKNCNYCKEYIDNTSSDYELLFSWADQKKNLSVRILKVYMTAGSRVEKIGSDTLLFPWNGEQHGMRVRGSWNDEEHYHADIYVDMAFEDDESVIEGIKEGFRCLKTVEDTTTSSSELSKVCRRTDGFAMCSAPSRYDNFSNGKTFHTQVIQLPIAEVIGRFYGDVEYQMRYVKTLTPIVLADLSEYGEGLMIDGVSDITECQLPKECHQEILERAVTLAKIAWLGGTATTSKQQ